MSQSVTPRPPFLDTPITNQGRFSKSWNQYNVDVSDALANLTSQLASLTAGIGQGVTDGSDAAAGKVGEYLTASGSSAAFVSNAIMTVASLVLTPGDWDVSASVLFHVTSANTNRFAAGIDTLTGVDLEGQGGAWTGVYRTGAGMPVRRNVTVNTSVVLVAAAGFSGGAVTADGIISARRVR